jgi:hypothetical protein
MLKQILELLQCTEHYGQSELIEIAKGKYELPGTFKKGYTQIKREMKWLKSTK